MAVKRFKIGDKIRLSTEGRAEFTDVGVEAGIIIAYGISFPYIVDFPSNKGLLLLESEVQLVQPNKIKWL